MLNYLLLFIVAIVWGASFITIKSAIDSFDPFVLMAIRFFVASLPLYIWIKWKKLNPWSFLKWGLITAFAQFMGYAPQTIGLKYTTPSNSAFITGLFIIFVPVANLLLIKKRPRISDIIATIVAVSGLWILTGGIQNLNSGDFITLITPISIAVYLVLSANAIKEGVDVLVITFHQLFFVAVLSAIIGIFTGGSYFTTNYSAYWSLLYLAIPASFLAYIIQNYSFKKVNPVLASIILATEPFWALIFSWIFKYEDFSVFKLIGGIMIISAVVITELRLAHIKQLVSNFHG